MWRTRRFFRISWDINSARASARKTTEPTPPSLWSLMHPSFLCVGSARPHLRLVHDARIRTVHEYAGCVGLAVDLNELDLRRRGGRRIAAYYAACYVSGACVSCLFPARNRSRHGRLTLCTCTSCLDIHNRASCACCVRAPDAVDVPFFTSSYSSSTSSSLVLLLPPELTIDLLAGTGLARGSW